MKPANVLGQPKSHTPKFDMKKNNNELFKIATLFIFFEKYPMHEIPIIDMYTKGVIE